MDVFGKFTFLPTRRQRIIVEGAPYRFEGHNQLERSITYNGRVYNLSDEVTSGASLDYVFGGYQYDVLSGDRGHLGLQAGAAYLRGEGTIRSVTTQLTGTRTQTIGLPLAGVEFRTALIPGSRLIQVSGELKGMAFGGYGHYVHGMLNGGIALGQVILQGGYFVMDADVHESGDTLTRSGVAPRIQGPMVSVVIPLGSR